MRAKGLVIPEVLDIQGRYVVQLCDERGKVKEQVASNYVTPLWANAVKTQQLLNLIPYGFPFNNGANLYRSHERAAPDIVAESDYLSPFYGRPLPMDMIILTDSDEVENTNVHWLKGRASAFASMWKSASIPAAGRRGQLNEAECTVNSNYNIWKWVWDWSTQQGNGVFQTLALGRLHPTNSPESHMTACGPYAIRLRYSTLPSASGSLTSTFAGQIAYNPTTKKWIIGYFNIATGMQFWSAEDPTDTLLLASNVGVSGHIMDLEALTWTRLATPAMGISGTTSLGSTTAFHYNSELGLYPAADGGFYYFHNSSGSVSAGNPGYARLAKVSSTGAAVWGPLAVGASSGSTYFSNTSSEYACPAGVVELGSYIYLVLGTTGTNNTHRNAAGTIHSDHKKIVRVDAATGAHSANLTLPSGMFIWGGLTTDGTDLFTITNWGIARIDTSGNLQELYGLPSHLVGGFSELGLSPFETSTSSNVQYGIRDTGLLVGATMEVRDATRTASHYMGQRDSPFLQAPTHARFNLQFFNDRLWLHAWYLNTSVPNTVEEMLLGITGANCFSRALLDSAITKTSSQTMKISYEITTPSPAALIHDHPAVV